MVTRRQLLAAGLAGGLASVAGCSSPRRAGNGRRPREFGVVTDPWHVDAWSKAVGARPTMVMEFESWDKNRRFDNHFAAAQEHGMRAFTVTWEPWEPVDASLGRLAQYAVQPKYSNAAIAGGRHDSYIAKFAESVKQADMPVYIRYAHEMTGYWYPWSLDPDNYIKAWRHVVGVFRSVGADNAKFLFAPAPMIYQPDDAAWFAHAKRYWPGPDHVDYVATTAINLGGTKTYTLDQFVRRLKLMHTTWKKDAILAEVNSAADGRVKFFTDLRTWLDSPGADWVRGAILSLLPSRAQAMSSNLVGNLDWQVANDPETRPVVRALIQDIT